VAWLVCTLDVFLSRRAEFPLPQVRTSSTNLIFWQVVCLVSEVFA
jgi:hypothetical protein